MMKQGVPDAVMPVESNNQSEIKQLLEQMNE